MSEKGAIIAGGITGVTGGLTTLGTVACTSIVSSATFAAELGVAAGTTYAVGGSTFSLPIIF